MMSVRKILTALACVHPRMFEQPGLVKVKGSKKHEFLPSKLFKSIIGKTSIVPADIERIINNPFKEAQKFTRMQVHAENNELKEVTRERDELLKNYPRFSKLHSAIRKITNRR